MGQSLCFSEKQSNYFVGKPGGLSKGISVKFFRTAALINQLSAAQEHGILFPSRKKMDKAEIIILDEFGYVPYNRTDSQLLCKSN